MANRHMTQPWTTGHDRADSKYIRKPCAVGLSGSCPVLTRARGNEQGLGQLGNLESGRLSCTPSMTHNYRPLDDLTSLLSKGLLCARW